MIIHFTDVEGDPPKEHYVGPFRSLRFHGQTVVDQDGREVAYLLETQGDAWWIDMTVEHKYQYAYYERMDILSDDSLLTY